MRASNFCPSRHFMLYCIRFEGFPVFSVLHLDPLALCEADERKKDASNDVVITLAAFIPTERASSSLKARTFRLHQWPQA